MLCSNPLDAFLNSETMDLRFNQNSPCICDNHSATASICNSFSTLAAPSTLISVITLSKSRSKGRTVADSIAARLTRPTAYKFKTDCSIIPVWIRNNAQPGLRTALRLRPLVKWISKM
ncbi:hypothetical protein Tco_1163347 [Tanacetum coccineum]